ncbi:hypothetical protein OGR47_02625 [Methylocystis sp. MJC1]|uniref:hypothetical protein n=1 Tax=Methylocystis sp. MJC1 TaxID=2654282 RepID=UPI0013EAA805|nr:hypothetical protein [Methylocystis sp. MJC1]KAF2991169.1 hypothetical protein MJC1_01902 [Methylocystis sp. MJC1]MBU6525908.1 hypothetical protein [Methylocystis sp. MJC1]UZX12374.1 hypothetical protein OGR47_02625 [Methylocystis sp. MJC1]
MKKHLLAGAMALAIASTPARADFLSDLFGGSASWVAMHRSGLASVAQSFVGRGNFTGFRGPWCGAAMSEWVALYTGRNPHILRARDWARFGRPSRLVPGAIVSKPHHVFVSTDGRTCGIGGNEHGRVENRCGRSLRGVIAIRAPSI